MGLLAPVTVQRQLRVSIGEPPLIRDGGLLSPGLPEWTPERKSPYAWDPAAGHATPGSIRLDGPFDRRLVHWNIIPSPGRPMHMRAWVKPRDLNGGLITLNIAFFGADKWLGSWCLAASGPTGGMEPGWSAVPALARIPTGTADWTLVEATVPAASVPAAAATAAFYIDAKDAGTGAVWFDDFDLWQPAAR
jgi:hypothetical protein